LIWGYAQVRIVQSELWKMFNKALFECFERKKWSAFGSGKKRRNSEKIHLFWKNWFY